MPRLACLQWTPTFMDPAASRARADALLENAGWKPGDVDVLVLPEMAFTGYNFASREEIAPFVEDAATGATTAWAQRWAKLLAAYVVVGFPQVVRGGQGDGGADVYYNAVVVVDPSGAVAAVYQKHFLYETDEHWAAEGPAFRCVTLPGLGKVGLDICMDVNPYRFEAPFDKFEYGRFLAAERPSIVLLSMAWLRSESADAQEDGGVGQLHQYWLLRLRPLLFRNCTVAVCNRTGTERGVRFAGGSCVLSTAEPAVRGHLGATTEGVLVVNV